MHAFNALVMMQLKDKLDFSFLKSKKQIIFKIVFAILKFAIITAVIYFGFVLLTSFRLVSLLSGIPEELLTIIFALMFLLSIIVCTAGLVKSLYYSKDNLTLMTLPASKLQVFSSKMVVYFIYELIKNLTYILPLFIAYGIINGMAFYYFIWLLPAILLYTLTVLALSALLSIPAMYIAHFVGGKKWLEISLAILGLIAVVTAFVMLILIIPNNFDLVGSWGTTFWKMQAFFGRFVEIFKGLYMFLVALVGQRYGVANLFFNGNQLIYLAGLIGIIAVLFGLTFLIVRPHFFKMVSNNFEYKKKDVKKELDNKPRKSIWSFVRKEALLTFRTPEKLNSLLFIGIGLPLAILLLNKVYAAIDTRLTGAYMTLAFNILMILLILLSSNGAMAKVYSEEGNSAYLSKVNPKSHLSYLFSKLIINIAVYTVSLLAAVVIFTVFAQISAINAILIFLMAESLYIGHLLYSAELDIMNPQNNQYATTGTHVYNKNEMKSSLIAVLISAVFAFITYFLVGENANTVWVKLAVVAAIYLAVRIYLYISKIKVYYKEK